MKQNQVARTLVSIYFGSPRLERAIKTNSMKLETVDAEICAILMFLKKDLGLVYPPYFVHDFSIQIFLILFSFT